MVAVQELEHRAQEIIVVRCHGLPLVTHGVHKMNYRLTIFKKILCWAVFLGLVLILTRFVYVRVPTSENLIIEKSIITEKGKFDFFVYQYFDSFAEPYWIKVGFLDRQSNVSWEEQIAFEELKWIEESDIKYNTTSGVCVITRDGKIFAVVNVHEKWFIDAYGNYFTIPDK